MATYEHNALMQYIDEKGNMHINYPATKAENVIMGNGDAQSEITARAKTSDVLYTLEEISACTDFTNKISGAKAVSEVNQNLNNIFTGSFTSDNYNVEYAVNGKIVSVRVYRNASVSSRVDVTLKTKIDYKPKNKMAMSSYVCKNGSFIEIGEAGGIRVVHEPNDGWLQACITYVTQ